MRAERQLDEDADERAALQRREEGGQRAHDLGGVVHRIGGEQQVLQLAGRQRGAHGVLVERAVGGEQQAEAVDGHRTDLPPETLERADDDERRPRRAVGVLRGDQAERLEREASCRAAGRARRSRSRWPGRGRSCRRRDTSSVSTCTAMPSGGLIASRASNEAQVALGGRLAGVEHESEAEPVEAEVHRAGRAR